MLMYMFVETRIRQCYMRMVIYKHLRLHTACGLQCVALWLSGSPLGEGDRTRTIPRPSPPPRWHRLLLLQPLCSPTSAMRVVSWNVQGMGRPSVYALQRPLKAGVTELLGWWFH